MNELLTSGASVAGLLDGRRGLRAGGRCIRPDDECGASSKAVLAIPAEAMQDENPSKGFGVRYGTDAGGVYELVITFNDVRGEQCLHVRRPSLAVLGDLMTRLRRLEGLMDRIDQGTVEFMPCLEHWD